MANTFESFGSRFPSAGLRAWRRWAIIWGVVVVVAFIALLLTWNAFFVYVPPGKHLVIIAKEGDPLPAGQVLAGPGEKGIRSEVQAEGWHFVMPVKYATEIGENTEIPPGKVGIVTARGGVPLKPNQVLADEGQQGIQRRVLPPGTYRINKHGFTVEMVDAVEILPGFVGVPRRLLGKDGLGRFATNENEKGILRQVFQPGLYYVNSKEFEIIKAEVGIFQTTFHFDSNPELNTALNFTSKGGFPISLDCTIEWEVLPDDMPDLVAEYGHTKVVEQNVIEVQAHAIGRDKGIDYGVQDFLEGKDRERFQQEFTRELVRVCREKKVTVTSAFIRNIVIPEAYLKPIREKQIAEETRITNKAMEATAQSVADVEREQQMITQKGAEVEAETMRLVTGIDRSVENVGNKNKADIEKLKAEYEARIASLEAQRIRLVGQTAAEVTKLKETAKSSLVQMKLDVFQNDSDAFLRYSLAEKLNPKMVLRLFQSGPGTFWTNMGDKSFNLMLPVGAAQPAPTAKPASK